MSTKCENIVKGGVIKCRQLHHKSKSAGLRIRSPENKAEIVAEVEKNVWPAIVAGKVKPVVYKKFPLSKASEAHRLLLSSQHIGKILLLP